MCCKLCLSLKIITTIQLHLVERWFVLLQLSVTVEHATGGPHKAAYNKFLTKKGLGLRERTAKVNGWHDTGQMSLFLSHLLMHHQSHNQQVWNANFQRK